jgi:16S rRNA (uracil1498-N3)-methyltransferase
MGRDKDRDPPDIELADTGGKVRLFVEARLGAGTKVMPSDGQAHYLLHVMRSHVGDHVLLFNGVDGEWPARINEVTRRSCTLLCETQSEAQAEVPDLWLAFAPIKKIPADYLAQKATELGAKLLQPVMTNRTMARRVNLERMRANAIEAAEQSGRLSVPEIREPISLDALLRSWPTGRRLLFCDEGGDAAPIAKALDHVGEQTQWCVLTGPEGGFDPQERAAIRECAFVLPVTLGPRIMRADTAALAGLAVWQSICGDWR